MVTGIAMPTGDRIRHFAAWPKQSVHKIDERFGQTDHGVITSTRRGGILMNCVNSKGYCCCEMRNIAAVK